ncbi:hypothetical protein N7468_001930 [Penicillium chermesinum]|uniref:Uncharacterized protein n=1 Tax=Penicillium chermesinum TaxID=63820 RepID=A0A9W9P8P7_9EURO|nr:uncharacterized protein N7468_004650 [Penicillium chermesinum]XP_058334368.1 uncharacterized protein N7468_001930 [Penicillium chermesinum]KAJ5240031.1 hypothetical protein N7468_004650 [Penicillium chermesinum]KAJ5246947.1 hypothetical protein N7468_001930 [Penicillium chermesinum]
MQQEIAAQRKKALAQVMRLEQQEALLRERAGDFIAREFKEISELEDLERREAEELARIEKERVDTEKQDCGAESVRAAGEVSQSASSDPVP